MAKTEDMRGFWSILEENAGFFGKIKVVSGRFRRVAEFSEKKRGILGKPIAIYMHFYYNE